MRILSLVMAGLLALCASVLPAHAETWAVASEENFPPYNFTDNGRRTGMDVEIVNAVLKHIGVEPEHQALPWNRVVGQIDQNQVDLAFQFVAKPERFEKYHMVGPHRAGLTVFAVRTDSAITFDKLEDLSGLTVGTVNGFSYTPEFDQAGFIKKDPASENALNLRKLAMGRIDTVVGDLHTLAYLARQEKLADKIRFLPKPLSEVPRYIAFPKARGEQARRFAKGLEDLQADGSIRRIIDTWQKLD